ncbi:DUF2269 family protein [Aquisalimonas sp.]|uniref:DUF2269 family protein n=1 Tax=Aquisalimonas sp. TaxID=1872621 RepID=UPI0025C43009|nr:DUF2269 family protein [Aquisalimonas sp.]
MDTYGVLKVLHVLGAVIFLGNIIVTAWWKVMADCTRDPRVVAFAQRQVTLTDFVFTALGVLLLGGTGYAMVFGGPWSFDTRWLDWGQSLFLATGIVWVGVLIPIQFVQARMARAFAGGGEIPVRYRQLAALWMGFGILAIVLPLAALSLMVLKPV